MASRLEHPPRGSCSFASPSCALRRAFGQCLTVGPVLDHYWSNAFASPSCSLSRAFDQYLTILVKCICEPVRRPKPGV